MNVYNFCKHPLILKIVQMKKLIIAILIMPIVVSCGAPKHKLKSIHNNENIKIMQHESGFDQIFSYKKGDTITIARYKMTDSFLAKTENVIGRESIKRLLETEDINQIIISKFILKEKMTLN